MPRRPPRPCSYPGCPRYATKRARCDQHQPVGWVADTQRGTRHERGYGTRWDKLRQRVLQRDDYLCQVCLSKGRVTPANEVDHITPKAQGGTDAEGNLQAICRSCHRDKTAKESTHARDQARRVGRGRSKV
ncbi:MAG: HNH endonuclease [Spiribacter salinus]|uniref:HNH endonuclease n=1 Tax=Spiribacter salinus TaxID=1335746 RepID=A0A540V7M9_9GAMM|nr:MAG: HNH endonuclease [Spiribacter salinus]